MCTNTVNVSWDGKLYDCDFNQQLELGLANLSVFDLQSLDDPKLRKAAPRWKSLGLRTKHCRSPKRGTKAIATGGHCFSCTAAQGSG